MARYLFNLPDVQPSQKVRVDTASGSDSPATGLTTVAGDAISSTLTGNHGGELPEILGPDGVTTLYLKTLTYSGAVTGSPVTVPGYNQTPVLPGNAASLPPGGATGQVLAKRSATDSDVQWSYAKKFAVNVKDYGAVGDAVSRTDGVTNGTTTFTAAGAAFVAGDVGKPIIVYAQGPAAADLVTTISAVNSSTSVTLATAATGSASSRPFTYGTDNTTAITNAVAALGNTTGKTLYFPPGRYYDTAQRNFDLTSGITILGDSNAQWRRDNTYAADPVPAPVSEWVYAGTTAPFISARGSQSFATRGIGISYVRKAFAGTIVDLSGNSSRHTLAPSMDSTYIGMNGDVLTAAACLDLRGMVVFNADRCSFGGATAAVVTVNGTDTFSNAVTFNRCLFDRVGTAGYSVNATVGVGQWTFADCTVETAAFGNEAAKFAFAGGQGITFDHCGLWDADNTQPWIVTTGTVSSLNIEDCYVQGGSYLVSGATIVGLTITGNAFVNAASGAASSLLNAPTTSITKMVLGGNSFDTHWTDNARNTTGALPEGVIARTVVGVGGVATISFASIPQTYENLRIVFSGRGDTAANSTQLRVQFNGDTTAIYDDQALVGNATAATADESIGQTTARLAKYICAGTPAAGNWSTVVTHIVGYTRTVGWKIAQSTSGTSIGTGTGQYVSQDCMGRWRNTAAITSITLLPGAGNFAQGTVVTLYGDN